MRGGLWSSFSVPAAGIFTYLEVYCVAGHRPVGLIGVVGVANTPPQESPAWNCWSGVIIGHSPRRSRSRSAH